MTVFGVRLEQARGPLDQMNRFYMDVANHAAAVAGGLALASELIGFFGPAVTFNNIHVWSPGVNPNEFTNQPCSLAGVAGSAETAIPSEIVVRWRFPVAGSYTNYKDFRVAVQANYIAGETWSLTYLEIIEDARSAFWTIAGGYNLCTRAGVPLGAPVNDPQLRFHQLSPKWYNRT